MYNIKYLVTEYTSSNSPVYGKLKLNFSIFDNYRRCGSLSFLMNKKDNQIEENSIEITKNTGGDPDKSSQLNFIFDKLKNDQVLDNLQPLCADKLEVEEGYISFSGEFNSADYIF